MAKLFSLKITTPDGDFFDGEIESLTVKTLSGARGFLAGAGDIFCALDKGDIKFKHIDKWLIASTEGGYLSANGGSINIIALECAFKNQSN